MISVLVASTLVSATQFLKALYMGGMSLDSHGLRPVSSSAFNNQETSRNLSSTKYYHHRATINQTSTVSRLMHLPSNTMYYLPSKWNWTIKVKLGRFSESNDTLEIQMQILTKYIEERNCRKCNPFFSQRIQYSSVSTWLCYANVRIWELWWPLNEDICKFSSAK